MCRNDAEPEIVVYHWSTAASNLLYEKGSPEAQQKLENPMAALHYAHSGTARCAFLN